jgi:hypothetical protein
MIMMPLLCGVDLRGAIRVTLSESVEFLKETLTLIVKMPPNVAYPQHLGMARIGAEIGRRRASWSG